MSAEEELKEHAEHAKVFSIEDSFIPKWEVLYRVEWILGREQRL